MTAFGWLFMTASVGGVTGLVVWCFYRVLTAPSPPDDDEPPAGA